MNSYDYVDKLNDPYPKSKRKLFCNSCQIETNHIRIFGPIFRLVFIKGDYEDESMDWVYVYHLWSCAGCDDISLEIMKAEGIKVDPAFDLENMSFEITEEEGNFCRFGWDKENLCWKVCGPHTGVARYKEVLEEARKEGYKSQILPKRIKWIIYTKKFQEIPEKLNFLYEECIAAYNNDCNILCAVGLRSLLEGICIDRGAPERMKLAEKIEFLKGDFPENFVNDLHEFRFMGNEAAHDFEEPSKFVLRDAIVVIETLMNYLYQLKSDLGKIKINRRLSKLDFDDLGL